MVNRWQQSAALSRRYCSVDSIRLILKEGNGQKTVALSAHCRHAVVLLVLRTDLEKLTQRCFFKPTVQLRLQYRSKQCFFWSVLDTAFHIQCQLKHVTNCLEYSMLCPEVFRSLCMSAAGVLLNSDTHQIRRTVSC